jgi:transcription initiation factor IIE alpha subunit
LLGSAALLSFQELRDMHARGLGLCDVLVLAFLRQYGRLASEHIAHACGISERSVYRALRRLRERRLLTSRES